MRGYRAKSSIFVAATLAFALAGSAVASAEPGTSSDQPDTTIDRITDRPIHRITDRPTDRPVDRPVDRPDFRRHRCGRDPAPDRPADCRSDDGDSIRPIWRRCWDWVADQDGLRIPDHRRGWWQICHRLLWNHQHPE